MDQAAGKQDALFSGEDPLQPPLCRLQGLPKRLLTAGSQREGVTASSWVLSCGFPAMREVKRPILSGAIFIRNQEAAGGTIQNHPAEPKILLKCRYFISSPRMVPMANGSSLPVPSMSRESQAAGGLRADPERWASPTARPSQSRVQ